jgi:hypothetical protein
MAAMRFRLRRERKSPIFIGHQPLCTGFDQRTAFEAFPLTGLLLKSALAN